MHGMGLRGQDVLHCSLCDAGRDSSMGCRQVFANVFQHVFAALEVFIKKIGSELRVQDVGGLDGESHKQQTGTTAMKSPATMRRLRRLQSRRFLPKRADDREDKGQRAAQ